MFPFLGIAAAVGALPQIVSGLLECPLSVVRARREQAALDVAELERIYELSE